MSLKSPRITNLLAKKSHWFWSLLIWIVISLPAKGVELRVAIQKDVDRIKIGSSTTAIVKNQAGQQIGELTAMSSLTAKKTGQQIDINNGLKGTELIVEPQDGGYVWIGERWYRGRTRLILDSDAISAINHVNLEDYLYSVVGAEAISTWPIEALKAQAVAARSYALYKRDREVNPLYDLDTTVSTQVYKGLDSEYTTTHQAVNETMGQIMTYDNRVILAAFHSSSGGHTENVEDVWSSPLPYLRAVVDYDHQAPVFEWQEIFPVSRIKTLVAGVGNIRGLQPVKLTPRGRIVTMKITGDRGTTTVTGKEIRQTLELRSTLFRMSTDGENLRVSGRGFGHGLGLSQWGAYYLARKGVNYHRILAHYYQNASLTKLE